MNVTLFWIIVLGAIVGGFMVATWVGLLAVAVWAGLIYHGA